MRMVLVKVKNVKLNEIFINIGFGGLNKKLFGIYSKS